VIEAINAGDAPTRYRPVVLTPCHVIECCQHKTLRTHPLPRGGTDLITT
jgi:hypothetical protein